MSGAGVQGGRAGRKMVLWGNLSEKEGCELGHGG